jgi:hypothetical protein|tara:strand:+ start:1070 stop:1453 length:384 start_codon:yes stop_codon:yes gene_type:complete
MNQLKIKFLEERLIKYIGFVSEPIMNHLIETASILKEYGAPDYLIDAGLFHSIYGEASSRNVPRNKYLTRDELIDMIGKDAEEIVYEYSSIESPRTENILNYPAGQLKEDLILLDKANDEQMKMRKV